MKTPNGTRYFTLVHSAKSLQDITTEVDEELKTLQDDGNVILDVDYRSFTGSSTWVAIIKYTHTLKPIKDYKDIEY